MKNGSAPALTRLLTRFGTIVYADRASGQLRHGMVDDESAVVLLSVAPAPTLGGDLVASFHLSAEESSAESDLASVVPAHGPTRVIGLPGNLVALKSRDTYLCAEPDGKMTFSRTRCSAWEFFNTDPGWLENTRQDELRPRPEDSATIDWAALPVAPTSDQPPCDNSGPFTSRRVIVLRHRGNLGNKMLQYMGALTLAKRIEGCTIVNVSIPEWGIDIPDDTQGQLYLDNIDLWTWDAFRPHVQELCALANRSTSIRIMMADHLQRMEFLMSKGAYEGVFPKATTSEPLSDQDLLINIRAAEILDGIPHYPLIPASFYEDIVSQTGLRPVFMGQLTNSEYVRQLRKRFPTARFIESQGAIGDFNLIRSAKNVIVSVSTFSWLAAWLSDATSVIVPLCGFYNPSLHREIDLLPVDDIRYRYFLFPLYFGQAEAESLEHHERIAGSWKEISRNQVALLKTASPFLRPPRENYYSGLPNRTAQGSSVAFDSVWYAHQYLDAAMEISSGWFEDPLHHYLEVGRLRGYQPVRPSPVARAPDLGLANLALNKPAKQSSTSAWSRGRNPEEDARRALDGDPAKDYAFHTSNSSPPWWSVDLGAVAHIHWLRIFNRDFVPEWVQTRASPLHIETSEDEREWTALFSTQAGHLFGGYSSGNPLVWSGKDPVKARFVRISLPRPDYLHLSQVEVYGRYDVEGEVHHQSGAGPS